MATLEQILHHIKIGFAALTVAGGIYFTETVAEAGKYKSEAHRVAKSYERFLKKHGVGKDDSLGLLEFITGKPAHETLSKHLAGVGSMRNRKGVVACMIYSIDKPNQRYIMGNGRGWGMSDGINILVDEGYTRSGAYEDLWTEETIHLARPDWSESQAAQARMMWYLHRAKATKDPNSQTRYKNLAIGAFNDYKRHCKKEGKPVKLREPKADHGHGHSDHVLGYSKPHVHSHGHAKSHGDHGHGHEDHGDGHDDHGHHPEDDGWKHLDRPPWEPNTYGPGGHHRTAQRTAYLKNPKHNPAYQSKNKWRPVSSKPMYSKGQTAQKAVYQRQTQTPQTSYKK